MYRVFHYFEEISAVPRCSGNTKGISDYLEQFAQKYGLRYVRDDADNIVIYKPASPGNEHVPPVILQGHCDMVGVKKEGSNHDFSSDGLKLQIKGDLLTATDTSLGADDGIAIAYCLAILESQEMIHPPLEVVLTSDEEVGLVGASRLDTSCLAGKRLLNLDYSTEGTFLAGCAGGLNVFCECAVQERAEVQKNQNFENESALKNIREISISGLKGGHSGIKIGENHANSCKLTGELLAALNKNMEFGLLQIDAGARPNVIPETARIVLTVSPEQQALLEKTVGHFEEMVKREYGKDEPELTISVSITNGNTDINESGGSNTISSQENLKKIITFLLNAPDGVRKMSSIHSHLVESSVNFGEFHLDGKGWNAGFGIRSSYDSVKDKVAGQIECLTEIAGGKCSRSGEYPAWEYQQNSPLRETMCSVYEEMFGIRPEIGLVHAGLECGYFCKKIPGLDSISFAPSMYGIHTADEALDIPSAGRMWDYLKRVLDRLCY